MWDMNKRQSSYYISLQYVEPQAMTTVTGCYHTIIMHHECSIILSHSIVKLILKSWMDLYEYGVRFQLLLQLLLQLLFQLLLHLLLRLILQLCSNS